MTWWIVLVSLVLVAQQAPARDPRALSAAGTGVIRGTVVDEVSEAPIAGARVTASQRGFDSRNPVLFSREVTAGDDGRFELGGLPAGELVISANAGELRSTHLRQIVGHDDGAQYMGTPSLELAPGEVKADLRIVLKRSVALEGIVVDEFGEPMAGVNVIARSVGDGNGGGNGVSDDRGWFRIFGLRPAAYVVCAEAERPWSVMLGRAVDDARTRYSRSCTAEYDVSPTAVPSVQVHMQRVASYRLAGRVISSSGLDVSKASVGIVRTGGGGEWRSVSSDTRNGEFVARDLLPGEYLVFASLPDPSTRDRSVPIEGARASVRVDDSDLTELRIVTTPAGGVVGRVVRASAARGPLPSGLRVTARQPLSDGAFWFAAPPTSPVDRSGNFELRGLIGAKAIAVTGLSGAWFVASVRQGDEDIRDRVRDFSRHDGSVVIVLSDRAATLRARPVDGDGVPDPSAMVLALPTDPARWHVSPIGPMAARDREGYQQLNGLAPGEYYLVAISQSDFTQWRRHADSLEPLASVGRRVTLAEDETLVVDVPVAARGAIR